MYQANETRYDTMQYNRCGNRKQTADLFFIKIADGISIGDLSLTGGNSGHMCHSFN